MTIVIGKQVQTVRELQGEEFYGSNVAEARRAVEAWLAKDPANRRLATLPDLLRYRVEFPDSPTWGKWYTPNSSEESGRTKGGAKVVVVSHGAIPWTAERTQRAYDEGLTPLYGGKLEQAEFDALVEGAVPYAEYAGMSDSQIQGLGDHRVVLNLKDARKTQSGVARYLVLRETPLFIARAGGRENANRYLGAASQKFQRDELGNWHIYNNNQFDADEAQGRVLCLSSSCNGGGLGGNNNLDNNGRSLGVIAPEAQRGESPSGASVIEMPHDVLEALQGGRGFEFNGTLYAPINPKSGLKL
jgi:hypothetical protein